MRFLGQKRRKKNDATTTADPYGRTTREAKTKATADSCGMTTRRAKAKA
jgi:hypothetical protein